MESEYLVNIKMNANTSACYKYSYVGCVMAVLWMFIFGSNGKKPHVYGFGGWIYYSDEELFTVVLDYKKFCF